MFFEREIPIYDFIRAISETVDHVLPVLNDHHKKVANISYRIAQEMKMPDDEIQRIVLAAIVHDIGAFSTGERLKLLNYESFEENLDEHAMQGYGLFKGFTPLAKVAKLIQYHHEDYDPLKRDVSLGSYVIHLADRVSVLPDAESEILGQVPDVVEKICLKKHKFHPDAFSALGRLTKQECFWFEVFLPSSDTSVLKSTLFSKRIIGLDILQNFAKLIARIIDFKSRFTVTHSSGVAAVARELSALLGFSERECKLMEIAGLLHDLGKLAVPNEILEKNGKLSSEEFNVIKKHTFYTYDILSKITGMEEIAAWAAYHHERQDGNGYPFHVKGEHFSKLARVMAVADVFTALTEDRPYRRGMDKKETMDILFDLGDYGGIDKSVVNVAYHNYLQINEIRINAQKEERNNYAIFQRTINQYGKTEKMRTA